MSSYDEIPDELIEYIVVKVNGYVVKKGSFDGGTVFGKFDSLKEACAAACILYRNNWRLMDVVADPLVKYGDEFWVFKVEENKLVLDNRFDDYESAVEYMEINLMCNDYHNDIFRNSSKRNGYKERWKFKEGFDDSVLDDECIFERNGRFIVKKSKRSGIIFGEFDSLQEASAAKKLLIDNNWRISGEHEVVFYKDSYWVFEVNEGILTFKGKSLSYEDALDLINPPTPQESENPYIKYIDENYETIISNRRKYEKARSNKSKSYLIKSNLASPFRSKFKKTISNNGKRIKFNVDRSRIWTPTIHKNIGNKNICVIVKQPIGTKEKKFTLDFNIKDSNISCIVNGKSIKWENRYNSNFKEFPELPLIIKIMEINQFDLSKLSDSSSIYYYDSYYKIHLLNKNTLIFDKFDSYYFADTTPIEYKGIPLKRLDSKCPLDIVDTRGVYEMVKFHEGEVFKISILKSLNEIKAIRDILILSNWDFTIFKKYDLFYLNGFYWELAIVNNVIYLIERYELIKSI